MRTGVIYKITIADKFYIGSTIKSDSRKRAHKCALLGNYHSNKYLQRLYNKYKEFNFQILQSNIPEIILRDVENIWIGSQCSKVCDRMGGINITDGSITAYVDNLNKKRSNILKIKRKLLSDDKKEEIASKISKSKKGKYLNWNNSQSFPILQICKTGEVVKLWASAYQAEKEANFSAEIISLICRKIPTYNSHRDYYWRYASKEDLITYLNLKEVVVPKVKKNILNGKSIIQKDLEGNIIKIWGNISEATKFFNVSVSRISENLNKYSHRTINGFKFEFLKEQTK